MTRDRISGLPGNIIDDILKDLSLRDAVRTSILSKEWRYKWVTVPHLVFDHIFRDSLHTKWIPSSVISHILLMHKGPIVKFTLMCLSFGGHVDIDLWIYLSSHPIEDPALHLSDFSVVGHHVFTFNHLKQLKLGFVSIKLPPTFKGFSGLVKLTLVCVIIAPEELQRFISMCPMLEFLRIKKYGCSTYMCVDIHAPYPCLDIDAPNLKYLNLTLVGIKPHTIFKGFSWLATLDIGDVPMAPKELGTFISKCPMLEFLRVRKLIDSSQSNPLWCLDFDAPNLKILILGRVDIRLPTTFRGFTRLVKLSFVNVFIAPKELQEFVSKCPVLEFLCIDECNDPRTLWRINIDAPNLKVLNLTGLFSPICLKTAHVEEIAIDYGNLADFIEQVLADLEISEPNGGGSNLINFFAQLPSLGKLKARRFFLEFLAIGGVPQELPNKLNLLTNLTLDNINFGNLDNVACTLCLIRSSPILQGLEIHFYILCCGPVGNAMKGQQERKVVKYMKAENEHKIPLNNLQTVRIHQSSGFETGVEFAKLLLLWGTVLRRLEVSLDFKTEGAYQAIDKLKAFHRASSSNAEFLIS